MAAAVALGAEGVQMGTRMVSAAESPVHQNWKDAIVGAAETGTVMLKPEGAPALRALRTERTSHLEKEPANSMAALGGNVRAVYFDGDLEAGIALTGQVAGRIDQVRPVSEILTTTIREFHETLQSLTKTYLKGDVGLEV
jgi:enoyl-[acyl-carrier protein] reductase II